MSDYVPPQAVEERLSNRFRTLRDDIEKNPHKWPIPFPDPHDIPPVTPATPLAAKKLLRELIEICLGMDSLDHTYGSLVVDNIMVDDDTNAFVKYVVDRNTTLNPNALHRYPESLAALMDIIFPVQYLYSVEFEHFRKLVKRIATRENLKILYFHPTLMTKVERILFVNNGYIKLQQRYKTDEKIWERLAIQIAHSPIETEVMKTKKEHGYISVYNTGKREYAKNGQGLLNFHKNVLQHLNENRNDKIGLEQILTDMTSMFPYFVLELYIFLIEENIDLRFSLNAGRHQQHHGGQPQQPQQQLPHQQHHGGQPQQPQQQLPHQQHHGGQPQQPQQQLPHQQHHGGQPQQQGQQQLPHQQRHGGQPQPGQQQLPPRWPHGSQPPQFGQYHPPPT